MNKKDFLIIILLFSLSCLFFNKVLLNPDKMPGYGDTVQLSYTYYNHTINKLIQGKIPLWNPYNFCGETFIGNIQTSIFYPLNLILINILPLNFSFGIILIIHNFLAGLFTYLFARDEGLNRESSLLAGIIFMFSNFFINQKGHDTIFCAISYFPLIFLFFKKSVSKKNIFYAIITGMILGIQILIGSPQISVYTFVGISIYWFFNLIEGKNYELKYLIILIIPLIIGGLISSVQLIPSLETGDYSVRGGGVSFEYSNIYSMEYEDYVTIFFPKFFGDREHFYWWKGGSYNAMSPYVGIMTLFLAAISVFLTKRNKSINFFFILAILGIILTFGNTIISFLFWKLPVFNVLRVKSRYLFLFNFSSAILAGWGLNKISNKSFSKKEKKKYHKFFKIISIIIILYISTSAFIIGFKLYKQLFLPNVNIDLNQKQNNIPSFSYNNQKINILGVISYSLTDIFYFLVFYSISAFIIKLKINKKINYFSLIVILFIIFNLWFYNINSVKVKDYDDVLMQNNYTKFLQKNLNLYRYHEVYAGEYDYRNDNILLKNYKIRGSNPIKISYYNKLLNDINLLFNNTEHPLINLIGVKFIVSDYELNNSGLKFLYYSNPYYLYENKEVFPRSFIISNDSECNLTIKNYSFVEKEDISNYCIYNESTIDYYSENEIIIKTNSSHKGFLILTDVFYPGWKAYVDGERTKIYRGFKVFRSIRINEGYHKIRFVFEPESFKKGAFLSLTTTSFCFFIILIKLFNSEEN